MDQSSTSSQFHAYNGQAPEETRSTTSEQFPSPSFGTLFMGIIVGVLATGWCLLDYWNRQISGDLFGIGNVEMRETNKNGQEEVVSPFRQFSYPLSLAFVQFVFMGVFFLMLYFYITEERPADLRHLKLSSDKRWPVLVTSHIFSTFWLQALVMPAQMLSIGLFAASRALEIPMAAVLRTQALGPRYGKKSTLTTGLATAAACLMFCSYGEMTGCVCVWSGNGVALSGIAFWLVYLMLLAMPAANAVCQESIMLQPGAGMHPILLLALQNIFASLLFAPILVLCHFAGWEDVSGGFEMMWAYSEVFMLVLWLCAQMAATSVLCITIIHLVDSFWAIALRAARVVFWAVGMISGFYMSNEGMSMSVASPRTSMWCFVLLCSVLLGAGATISDRLPVAETATDKNQAGPPGAPISSAGPV